MDKPYEAPRGRLFPTIVLFLFILALLYGLFLLFQQYSLNRGIDKVNEQVGQVQTQIEVLRDDQIEELSVAQEVETEVETVAIYWSKVIAKLQDLKPVTVFFSSYSGSEDGSIQLSGLSDNYDSVADLISVLDASNDFEEPFVPSATLGSTSDGQEVVSFSLQVQSDL
jgi:Tfp pilus assembly protein PilN